MASQLVVIVKSGETSIFEGSMTSFRQKFYAYPDDWSDEQVLENAQEWASNLKWTIEYYVCH
jgi:hypothetical protein